MPHPQLFEAMGVMYRVGKINSFADILKYVPRSSIAKAIGANGSRFKMKSEAPEKFTGIELEKLAKLFDMRVEDLTRICQLSRKDGSGRK